MTWHFYNNRGVLEQDGLPDSVPVGITVPFVSDASPSPAVPTGWLLCDGSVHASASYPRLAAILAYPAAPGANFTLPDMLYRIPVGVAGSYPLNSTGGTSNHPHSITSHSHTNVHTHNVSNHTHSVTHTHSWGSGHNHSANPYTTGAATASRSGKFVADTVTSLASHTHNITGTISGAVVGTGSDPTDSVTTEVLTTGAAGAATTSGQAVTLPATAPTLAPSGDILPPYLNVYFIIKAVDFSGTYI